MTKFTIEIDYDMSDKITFDNLKDCRARFLEDLGRNQGVFSWDDPEEDDAQIQKHIDALDLLLKWYGTPTQIKELYGE